MIVITTPTGQIGRQVITHLLAAGEKVRVIARDPDRIPPETRERVEVVRGSHGDGVVVAEAFAGADAVFWLPPPNPRGESLDAVYLDFARPACAALVEHGAARVVGVSSLGRGVTVNAGMVTASLAVDDLIAGTGVAYRALTLPSFMDNLLWQVDSIRDQGVFHSPVSGARKAPTCATRDIAAVAAGLLRDRSWSGRDDVPVLGPEDLSPDQMAQIMSEVLGRPVRFQQVPLPAYEANLLERGWSAAMARGMADMMAAKSRGLDNTESRTPQATSPTGFRQWCEDTLRPAVLGG